MAAFMAKQLVGSKIGAVKDNLKDVTGEKEIDPEEEEQFAELQEARNDVEDKRKEKHRKANAEREKIRSKIRTKYGLSKSKSIESAEQEDEEQGDSDEDVKIGDLNLSQLGKKITDIPGNIKAKIADTCSLQ